MCRRLLAALAPLLVAACQLAPEGRCERDGDCLAGQHCSASICVSNLDTGDVGASCAADADCDAWSSCDAGRCVLATGACTASVDCPSWTSCTDHACVPLPGRCGTSADCPTGNGCDARVNRCLPSCTSSAECAAWQECGPANVCVPSPGHCDDAGGCHRTQTCCLATRGCAGEDHACVDPALPPLAAGSVALWGTLEAGKPGLSAMARLEPRKPLDPQSFPYVGFGGSTYGLRAFVTGSGDLLYTQHESESGDRQRIRVSRQDSFAWDASLSWWRYPEVTTANDPEVPTPGCDAATTLTSWVVQRGTGEVLYACGGSTYFDVTGAQRLSGYELHAWQVDGSMLVTRTDATGTTWLALDPSGNEVPLTGFALASGETVVAVRTSVLGFRLVVRDAAGALSLWEVSELYSATELGEYPPVVGYIPLQRALDEDGALHVLASRDPPYPSPGEVVLRLTLSTATPPSETSIVYDEARAPGILWWTTDPSIFFVFTDPATSRLVTGP